VNRNLQRTYRKVLYALKRQYGDAITICRNTSVSTNYVSGVKEYTCTRTEIKRAILLPTDIARKTNYGISTISADKMFIFGGTFDVGSKIVVIDTRDVDPFFQLTQDDWLLIDNVRYEITKIEQLEYQAGWVLATKQIIGVEPDREITLGATTELGVSDTGSGNRDVPVAVTSNTGITDVAVGIKE